MTRIWTETQTIHDPRSIAFTENVSSAKQFAEDRVLLAFLQIKVSRALTVACIHIEKVESRHAGR